MKLLQARVSTDKYRNTKDLYACVCGKEFLARTAAVKSGHTKSCGCLKSNLLSVARATHGMADTSEFHTWQQMIQRCTNPKNARFEHYGARGITVCEAWANSFEAFYKDMGPRPPGLSLDRIDNDRGYSLDNCRWTDILTQNRNKRQRGPSEQTRRRNHK